MWQDASQPKRQRGERPRSAPTPELLVLVVDPRLLDLSEVTSNSPLFPELWGSLQLFLRAFGALALDQKAVLLAASSAGPVRLSEEQSGGSSWEAAFRNAIALPREGEPQMAAAISSALCLAQRRKAESSEMKLQARILVIEAAGSQVDYQGQSSALVNVAFAAKAASVLVDGLALGPCTSFLLRQVCILAQGKHLALPSKRVDSKGQSIPLPEVLAPSLLFHFLASADVRKELLVAPDYEHLPAVCRCHGTPQDVGYVCSCCLAIYCSDALAICQVCGTRFKRDREVDCSIKDLDPDAFRLLTAAQRAPA
ncbi:Gtf2h3 [Symbiodinium sp. CCMP2592]|nr:Gtf2h3 [Symbiodinium sp. CCMP2592]